MYRPEYPNAPVTAAFIIRDLLSCDHDSLHEILAAAYSGPRTLS
jgi:hypothetical protein